MVAFALRYDLRCPGLGRAGPAELYAAALEQCAWADRLGFASVVLSEHHGSPDGYLPSPLVLAAAVAARTRRLRLSLAALVAPLHDPIRLAEDLAVLDVISGGRLVPVFAAGYVASEFAAFGRPLAGRGRALEELVAFLERAWTGEPFEWRGRTLRVTPRPLQRPRPPILLGGSSAAAARRAARLADHFVPSLPEYWEVYRAERKRLGRGDPGPRPAAHSAFVHVAEDPEAAWPRIAPHALHEARSYGRWSAEAGVAGPYEAAPDAEALRRSGRYRVLTPDELVELAAALGPRGTLVLHPLMGGLDPELAWESLSLVESRVWPALRARGLLAGEAAR